ncbi:MAG: hypothetical protein EA389_10275 [Ilumatobacter sp.]|nr:MAG: hypothetical protein EA389_10275 [Ilumatobacter sp.]
MNGPPIITELRRTMSARLSDAVWAIGWSPSGRLAVVTADGRVMVDRPEQVTRPMCGAPVAVAWADDGRVAVSDRQLGLVMAGGGDHRCHDLPRARDIAAVGDRMIAIGGSTVWSFRRAVGGPPDREGAPVVVDARCAELHGLATLTGSLVAVAGTTGVAVVDLALGVVDTRVEIDGAISIAAHPAADFLAVGDLGGSIHVLEVGDEAAGRELTGYPDHVRLLGWAAGGSWLVATADDELTCWPAVASGWPAEEPICCLGHEQPITALAVGAHHDLVASGDAAGRLALWSLRVPDAPLHTIDLDGEVTAAVWSTDGMRLAVGTVTGNAAVFDVERGQLA